MQKKTFAPYPSYSALIKNSIGSVLFRNRYYVIGGKPIDVLENGNLSCAFFVSSILYLCGLISKIHTTVRGTVKDLMKRGWHHSKKPRVGAVLIYEEKYFKKSDSRHRHIGFYIGNGSAVSTSSHKHKVILHDWQKDSSTGTPRKVVSILWHKVLER